MMTDKIKKNEIDIIDKYSKMFGLNNEEKYSLYGNERRDFGGQKRLSTPMKDYEMNRAFNRKKYSDIQGR